MMRRSGHRNTPLFFEKENTKTFSQKINPKRHSPKRHSRASKDLELEFFALTPWALNQ